QRCDARAARAHGAEPRRRRRSCRRAERHDGRPGRCDPRRAARHADHRVLRQVRLGVLRAVQGSGRVGAVVRRPPRLPDGSRKRPRGTARMRAGHRRRRRRVDDQACASLPRRDSCGARALRPSTRRVQRLRRVLDGQSSRSEGIPGRAAGCNRVADGDQTSGRRLRHLLLDEGAGLLALRTRSELYRRALELIPGGVNSPVRAMRAVGLDEPFFVRRGEGAYIEDVEGNRYLDWVMSWGPLLFGHGDRETVEAVRAAAELGTSFGAPSEAEVELAAEIVDAVPSVEKVRLVSSGTEAAMSALRVARGFTKRDRVIKFAGGYHGHADALLASAGSGLATLAIPSSPGVPSAVTADTIVCPYNDINAVAEAVLRYGEGLAAIIVEPVAGNMGVVPPVDGFLEALRELCDASGALLIFDEVITGFRVARGGAQQRFGIAPDLTVLGKIVGGGLPLAAFGGRADVMEHLAPSGPVYQAGTLSGNPL